MAYGDGRLPPWVGEERTGVACSEDPSPLTLAHKLGCFESRIYPRYPR